MRNMDNFPDIVVCPICEHEQTHQIAVEIFSRKEDEKEISTLIDFYDGAKKKTIYQNPSSRRQGLRIIFKCEDGCKFAFVIYQYKGFTTLDYEKELIENERN